MKGSCAPVAVSWHLNVLEAEILRGRLECEGVPAYVDRGSFGIVDWTYTLACGGVRVMVPPSAFPEAQQIIADIEPLPAEEGVVCPHCGCDEYVLRRRSWKFAMIAVHMFAIPLPFDLSVVKCTDCGRLWREADV